MKECLKCGKEFQEKKETAKFCSTSCRVMFNRKKEKKDVAKNVQAKVILNQVVEAMDDLRNLIKSANINTSISTPYDAPKYKPIFDEPLQYKKSVGHQVTFQELLNGMSGLQFSDDKEDYAEKIRKATHLSEKQIKLLLSNLWS